MSIDRLFSKFMLFHVAAVCSTNRWFAISKNSGKWCFKVLLIRLVIEDQGTQQFLANLVSQMENKHGNLVLSLLLVCSEANLNVFSALQSLLRILLIFQNTI